MSYNKETGMHTGWIYLLTNQVTNLQYVGQTQRGIQNRWKTHCTPSSLKDGTRLHYAISQDGPDNFSVEKVIEISDTDKDTLQEKLNDAEKYYIEYYHTLEPYGYNMTPGGFNAPEVKRIAVDQYTRTGEFVATYDSMSDAYIALGYPSLGYNTIRQCCEGDNFTAIGYVWRFRGESFDKYIAQRNVEVGVDVYTKSGKLMGSYFSIQEAVRQLNLPHRGGITYCCQGKMGSSLGYVWRYHGDPFDKYNRRISKTGTPIYQYTCNGDFVAEFNTIRNACRTIEQQKGETPILRCLQHKSQTSYGFRWYYADDPDQPDKSRIIIKD